MRLRLVALFIFLSSTLIAQPTGGGPGGGGNPDNPVPIGGIELLIAAGAILGIKKVYKGVKK